MIDIFQYPDISFPDNFLWGAATAGQQIEGGNCSYHDDKKRSIFNRPLKRILPYR